MSKVNGTTPKRVYDGACDESSDRIRKKHERKRRHDALALKGPISIRISYWRKGNNAYRKQNKALSSGLCGTLSHAISDLYRKIDTKDVIMLSTEHKMATKPPIRVILSNSGRVMSVTEALKMMADCG